MWMWQAGLRNTVALIGAQATKAQRNQLKEFDRVILALDNDKAGRIGALTIGEALKTSCDVEYALYPDGRSDANDLTAEELQQVFAGTVTPLEMKLHG
jgi:DNA primase